MKMWKQKLNVNNFEQGTANVQNYKCSKYKWKNVKSEYVNRSSWICKKEKEMSMWIVKRWGDVSIKSSYKLLCKWSSGRTFYKKSCQPKVVNPRSNGQTLHRLWPLKIKRNFSFTGEIYFDILPLTLLTSIPWTLNEPFHISPFTFIILNLQPTCRLKSTHFISPCTHHPPIMKPHLRSIFPIFSIFHNFAQKSLISWIRIPRSRFFLTMQS